MPDLSEGMRAAGGRSGVHRINEAELEKLERYLWPRGMSRDMWMILDGARDRRIFSMLLECHLEYSCLYSGPLPSALELVAPYLLQLDFGYRDTRRFLRQAWGNSWGVFARADTGLETLRRHLRGFLQVQDATGSRMVFRYYDPRVLRIFLPTCTHEELRTLFGPIECFLMEDKSAATLLRFGFEKSRLVREELLLNLP